ncbi:hypothetical protein BGZ68_003762, partial [Mortierella alpina]
LNPVKKRRCRGSSKLNIGASFRRIHMNYEAVFEYSGVLSWVSCLIETMAQCLKRTGGGVDHTGCVPFTTSRLTWSRWK